jgi:hypothetical protein
LPSVQVLWCKTWWFLWQSPSWRMGMMWCSKLCKVYVLHWITVHIYQ